MTSNQHESDINEWIRQALQKSGAASEAELCRYLPGQSAGYMHHFTFKKLKKNAPAVLINLLKENIISNPNPQKLTPKVRAARGSRQRLEISKFSKSDMDRLLQVVLKEGDLELIKKLTPKPNLKAVKKQLILSIKKGEADESLWSAYTGFVQARASA